MSLDLEELRNQVAAHGRVARIVVGDTKGSVPRGVGTSMLVWSDGQSGTIGGGALEWEAVRRARSAQRARVDRIPLGPELGQCCGGAVALVTETWDAAALERVLPVGHHARRIDGPDMPPLAFEQLRTRSGQPGAPPATRLIEGWFIEPLAPSAQQLWIWGAGHVGRAVAHTVAPLANWTSTWIDIDADRFPSVPPDGITILTHAEPQTLVRSAPQEAHHLVMTFSHALDLELCHRLLRHGCASFGLIGSLTKRARFVRRLGALGHDDTSIARMACPIGDPALGKHPQAIAIGVAAGLIRDGSVAAPSEVRAP